MQVIEERANYLRHYQFLVSKLELETKMSGVEGIVRDNKTAVQKSCLFFFFFQLYNIEGETRLKPKCVST